MDWFIVALFLVTACCAVREVNVVRILQSPILSSVNSPYDYNYNSAYLPGIGSDCLAVRVQDFVGAVAPSKIAIFCENSNKNTFSSDPIVVIDPAQSPAQVAGCEDPRVAMLPDNQTLLMFFTAVNMETNGAARAKLSLASCNISASATCSNWTLHGALFPNTFWSKSGALLIRDEAPHFLLWGDTNITIAATSDFFHYENWNETVIGTRSDHFDSALVESGPPPMKLSDGTYLFLYNSAQVANEPSPKAGWTLQYNLGYAILNASAQGVKVLERSSLPIMSPMLGWETCNDQSMVSGLTPNVIFVNGAKVLGPNVFLLYYQGCDAKTGIALLTVTL
jgi:predicted GH43/DUF377 family glycosyl hydrolase